MPKPNFVKKPLSKLLDEPLSKLPDPRRAYCSGCGEELRKCECEDGFNEDFHPVDRDGLKD